MARNQPKMRVMKRDEQEYKRLRSNYRAKLWRLRRATDFTLPAHEIDAELGLYFPDIKEFRDGAFKTRKDFNAFKQTVEEVTSRSFKPLQIQDNARGIKYPRIMLNIGLKHAEKAKTEAQRQIDKIKDLPIIIDGEERGTVADREIATPDSDAYGIYSPSDFDIDNFTTPQAVEKRIEKDKQRSEPEYYDMRKEQMQQNFISMFDGQDPDEVPPEIVEMLKNMTPDEFYEFYWMFPDLSFEDFDSESGQGFMTNAVEELLYQLANFTENGKETPLSDIG